MSKGHGGARPGAGRKRKALSEKILTAGNGHHKITKLKDHDYADYSGEAASVGDLGVKSNKELNGAKITGTQMPDSEYGDIAGSDMPPVADYLKKMTKNANENIAPQIYEKTWKWLKARNCDQFIKNELIEQYALNIARWVQCEEAISTFGLIAKHPTTGSPIASPFVGMGLNFLRQSNIIWSQIFQIVKENSSVAVDGNPNDDIMAKLLKGKG